MANGTDARMKLAQSLSAMDLSSGNELQEMFDVLGDAGDADGTYDKYRPMRLLAELISGMEQSDDSFDAMKMAEINELVMMDLFEPSLFDDAPSFEKAEEEPVVDSFVVEKPARGRKKSVKGQMSLFKIAV